MCIAVPPVLQCETLMCVSQDLSWKTVPIATLSRLVALMQKVYLPAIHVAVWYGCANLAARGAASLWGGPTLTFPLTALEKFGEVFQKSS